jgi:hypothetical protein
MSLARAAAALLAALVGGAVSPIATIPVAIAMWPLRPLLVLAGVRFDEENDSDPNSLRWIAACIGFAVALGITASVIACGLLFSDTVGTLATAGTSGGLAAGVVAAAIARRGAPGASALPVYVLGTAYGALVAALVAAVSR